MRHAFPAQLRTMGRVRPRVPLALALVAMLLAACGAVRSAAGQSAPPQDLASFPRATVEIGSEPSVHRFDAWLADTPPRQAQGLMFVRDLPADRGMLFIHREPRVAGMWMKNTYVELDMLFIGTDGRIARIAHRTRPHSLETISSEVPVAAVLEIKGGEARRRGIAVGDRVRWTLEH